MKLKSLLTKLTLSFGLLVARELILILQVVSLIITAYYKCATFTFLQVEFLCILKDIGT
jgi:hypothetical protein